MNKPGESADNGNVEAGRDALLFGSDPTCRIVAVEHAEGAPQDGDVMEVFIRNGPETERQAVPFEPFLTARADVAEECPAVISRERLDGGGPLDTLLRFRSWKDAEKARKWLADLAKKRKCDKRELFLFVNDPVQQYLLMSGRTLFRGMVFEDIRRMQVDIECFTTAGYEFCNAERPGDRIIAIGMADNSGWVEVLSGADMEEAALISQFVEIVKKRDPDVIEGHNIFNFDLSYLAARAKMHGIKLKIGRDGSVPEVRASQFSAGERKIAYERFDVFGRHIVDTLFLLHAYDITHRSLDGLGLKEAAVHFGIAEPGRVYIEGSRISSEFQTNPARVMEYVRHDVIETRRLADVLTRSAFAQASFLPFSYQNVCVRGNAAKIDALLLREYLRRRHSLPAPSAQREFEGGAADIFVRGVVKNVHHADVRSLYPSLMLARKIAPSSDKLGVFLKLLEHLRMVRLDAREKMENSRDPVQKRHYDALQTAFKVLINSFYGYLGFDQGTFSDFDAAERVAAEGRAILCAMIEKLRALGAMPVEMDTDGIYFVPPPFHNDAAKAKFRADFASSLPSGIDIEFDGEYVSMFSYKVKNYALLCADGEIIIKGAALKSRGLEPFQRSFLRELVRLKLEGRDEELPSLKQEYEDAIKRRRWPITELAKTEVLQDSPATYSAKVARDGRARSAVYELALASGREYRAGDQISYYVTGDKKNVAVHEKARLVSEWNPDNRDENVPYYLAKLDALYKKFAVTEANGDGELDLRETE